MKHVFVVFDNSGVVGIELVGVFSTEAKAEEACLTNNHVMWAMQLDVPEHRPNVQGDEFPFGYKFPRIPVVSTNYKNPIEQST
jgi:hypothetical protein